MYQQWSILNRIICNRYIFSSNIGPTLKVLDSWFALQILIWFMRPVFTIVYAYKVCGNTVGYWTCQTQIRRETIYHHSTTQPFQLSSPLFIHSQCCKIRILACWLVITLVHMQLYTHIYLLHKEFQYQRKSYH